MHDRSDKRRAVLRAGRRPRGSVLRGANPAWLPSAATQNSGQVGTSRSRPTFGAFGERRQDCMPPFGAPCRRRALLIPVSCVCAAAEPAPNPSQAYAVPPPRRPHRAGPEPTTRRPAWKTPNRESPRERNSVRGYGSEINGSKSSMWARGVVEPDIGDRLGRPEQPSCG